MRIDKNAGYNCLRLQKCRIYRRVAKKGVFHLYDVIHPHHSHVYYDVLLREDHMRHLAASRDSPLSGHAGHRHAEDSLCHVSPLAGGGVRTRGRRRRCLLGGRSSSNPGRAAAMPLVSALAAVVAVRRRPAGKDGRHVQEERGKDDHVGDRRIRRVLDSVLCSLSDSYLFRLSLSADHRAVGQRTDGARPQRH